MVQSVSMGMDKMITGAVSFQDEDYLAHKELFEKLGKRQDPHTLFIGCSDSRLVPNLITNTLPGELFVVRNVANLIPPYRDTEEFVATTAAIEYALVVLNIKTILVCGHSNCGGCAAFYQSKEFLSMIPHVAKWLELGSTVKENVEALHPIDYDHKLWLTEQLNVVEQIRHLFTYPTVKERHKAGTIDIMGWYYEIETGKVFTYNDTTGHFDPIGT